MRKMGEATHTKGAQDCMEENSTQSHPQGAGTRRRPARPRDPSAILKINHEGTLHAKLTSEKALVSRIQRTDRPRLQHLKKCQIIKFG